jgi:hypothetical protein
MNKRLPSPALIISVLALFVALSGTALAAGIVPLAKRALSADKAKTAAIADNAKKLGGQTAAAIQAAAAQAAQAPGPASSVAALVSVKTAPFALAPAGQQMFTAACAAGEKAVGGGFTYDGAALIQPVDSLPTADGSGWQLYLVNFSDSQAGSGTIQVVCIK